MAYNIWSELKTKNDFPADEIISALQKSIRRGLVEDACRFAYELYITSPLLLDKLWRRLLAISVEDIGFGNLDAAGLVQNLCEMRKNFPYDDGDQPIFFIHAIRVLCSSEKDRSSDLLKNIIIKSVAMGELPVIPDIALDKHTRRGVAMGRDSLHFLNEASTVIPQLKVDNDYKARYVKLLETYDPQRVVPGSFTYSSTQY
ncbi:hypothetical protein [Superficieibacter sp. 1612_C1]|jgi:replication-associated recombination protein RarA|uniref:hypothetical protein n=1 Tax=Superficieibacter sp. 1612_C1 TaxID=2780382 RepID=UPI001883DCC0|nr:hypothetical protein [Superficieibacter sp. 1612_C1]